MKNREPLLAPILDKANAPLMPSGDPGQSRQLQAESNRLSAENAGERPKKGGFSTIRHYLTNQMNAPPYTNYLIVKWRAETLICLVSRTHFGSLL